MRPWAEAGRPSIRVPMVIGADHRRSMSFASAGRRHLCDDRPGDQDANRAYPAVSWLGHRVTPTYAVANFVTSNLVPSRHSA